MLFFMLLCFLKVILYANWTIACVRNALVHKDGISDHPKIPQATSGIFWFLQGKNKR